MVLKLNILKEFVSKNKKIILIIIAAILGVLTAFGIFAFLKYKQVVVKPNKKIVQNLNITSTATPIPDPNRSFSILLMGYGGGVHEGGKLTDSIILAQIIPKEEKIKLISIPRDLWVFVPIGVGETKMSKINSAYVIGLDGKKYPNKETQFTGKAGGGELSKYVVSQIVGFPVDNFLTINFAGFIKTIDTLGGIDISVQKVLDDPFYPIEEKSDDICGKSDDEIKAIEATASGDKLEQTFTCRYEHLHFDPGLQHMDGITALKFARSRHSQTDGGDFNRSIRQKLVIEAAKKKVFSINFIPKIITFINSLAGNLTTDIDVSRMEELISKADEYKTYKIESIALTNDNVLQNGVSSDHQAILIPKAGDGNWTDIQKFISQPTATSSAKNN